MLCSVQNGDKKADNKALGKTYDELTDQAYGLKLASAPKVMADLVESLVGAVYIDAGCQLEPAFKVGILLSASIPPALVCKVIHSCLSTASSLSQPKL